MSPASSTMRSVKSLRCRPRSARSSSLTCCIKASSDPRAATGVAGRAPTRLTELRLRAAAPAARARLATRCRRRGAATGTTDSARGVVRPCSGAPLRAVPDGQAHAEDEQCRSGLCPGRQRRTPPRDLRLEDFARRWLVRRRVMGIRAPAPAASTPRAFGASRPTHRSRCAQVAHPLEMRRDRARSPGAHSS